MNRTILVLALFAFVGCGPKSKPATPEEETAAPLDREEECDAATVRMMTLSQCPQLSPDELQVANAKMLLFLERVEAGEPRSAEDDEDEADDEDELDDDDELEAEAEEDEEEDEPEEPVVPATAEDCRAMTEEVQQHIDAIGCDPAAES